jgi:enamine deaminase RidA (YjgF/YER057c/UK114 family)
MEIQRIGIINPGGDLPTFSLVAVHGPTVYLCGLTADLAGRVVGSGTGEIGDARTQTQDILAAIDVLLARAGTDRSRLLTATVWLTDMADFAAMNAAWNRWVDPASPPVRACLCSPQLWRPGLRVEIMVTAARAT